LITGLVVAALLMPFSYVMGQMIKAETKTFLAMESELGDVPPARATYVYASDNTTLLTIVEEAYR
jgi:hypothetical protein